MARAAEVTAADQPAEPPDLPMVVVSRRADGTVPPVARPGFIRRHALVATMFLVGAVTAEVLATADPATRPFTLALGGTSGDSAGIRPTSAPRHGTIDLAFAPDVVVALGVLTPRGELATIAPPYGASDARVASLLVAEGERVTQGQRLAVLDNARALATDASAAAAEHESREAALAQVRDAARASRDEARSAYARAEATLRNARQEFERAAELRDRGVATGAAFDQKRAALDEAAQDLVRAAAALSRYDYDDLDHQPDVRVAARAVDAAAAAVAQAQAALDRAEVRAPRDGVVIEIHAWPGERPGDAGVLTLGDIDAMGVEIEVYQAAIGAVAVGAAVTIDADALPRPLSGVVTRIGLKVGRQTLTDASPAANTDARVVKVHVDLTPESAAFARGLSNLQVTARIARTPPRAGS